MAKRKYKKNLRSAVGSRKAIERIKVLPPKCDMNLKDPLALVLDTCVFESDHYTKWVLDKSGPAPLYITKGVEAEIERKDCRRENFSRLQEDKEIGIVDVDTSRPGLPLEQLAENELLKTLSYLLPKKVFHYFAGSYVAEVVRWLRPVVNGNCHVGFEEIKQAMETYRSVPNIPYKENISYVKDLLDDLTERAIEALPKIEGSFERALPVKIDLINYQDYRNDQYFSQARSTLVQHVCIGLASENPTPVIVRDYEWMHDPTRSTDRKQILAAQILIKTQGRDNGKNVLIMSVDSDIKYLRRLRFHSYKNGILLSEFIDRMSQIDPNFLYQKVMSEMVA